MLLRFKPPVAILDPIFESKKSGVLEKPPRTPQETEWKGLHFRYDLLGADLAEQVAIDDADDGR